MSKKRKDIEADVFPCTVNGCVKNCTAQGFPGHLRMAHKLLSDEEVEKYTREFNKIKLGFADPNSIPSTKSEGRGYMTEDQDIEVMSARAELGGKLRQTMRTLGRLKSEDREKLSEPREQLRAFIQRLGTQKVSYEQIMEIDKIFEDQILPKIEEVTGEPGFERYDDDADITMRKANLNSAMRSQLTKIARLPDNKRENLIAEKTLILEYINKLAKPDITVSAIKEFELIFNNSVKPTIDGVISGDDLSGPKVLFDEDYDDLAELDRKVKKMKKQQEYEMAKAEHEEMMELMKEKRKADIELKRAEASAMKSPQMQSGMVPVSSPKLDPQSGKVMTDVDGRIIMETTYKAPSQIDPFQMSLYQKVLGSEGGNTEIFKLMIGMMDNNQKTLITLMNSQNKGDSTKEIVHAFQTEMSRLVERLNKRDPEVEQLRSQNQQLLVDQIKQTQNFYATMMKQQEQTYKKDIEELSYAAHRNTLETLLQQKQQLLDFGIVSDTRKSPEEKAIDSTERLVNKGIEQVTGLRTDLKEMTQPFLQAQAKWIESQAQGSTIKRAPLSKEEKDATYRRLLVDIEGGSEEEEEYG